MKALKFVLPALAFVFAIAGAVVSQASDANLAAPYGLVPDADPNTAGAQPDCLPGTLSGTCNFTGTIPCKVTVSGFTGTFNYYNTDNGTSCADQQFRN